jgi:hypothetical protein
MLVRIDCDRLTALELGHGWTLIHTDEIDAGAAESCRNSKVSSCGLPEIDPAPMGLVSGMAVFRGAGLHFIDGTSAKAAYRQMVSTSPLLIERNAVFAAGTSGRRRGDLFHW